jgi:hypothetical protein
MCEGIGVDFATKSSVWVEIYNKKAYVWESQTPKVIWGVVYAIKPKIINFPFCLQSLRQFNEQQSVCDPRIPLHTMWFAHTQLD